MGISMKNNKNEYWQDVHNKDLENLNLKDEFKEGEFDSFSTSQSRRSFLKTMGFSLGMIPLATSCTKSRVLKAIPYLNPNDVIIPGVANWYATTHDGIPLLLKTREGRPIKVEGNNLSNYTKGGASPIAQASILSLYDSFRLRSPSVDRFDVGWSEFERDIKKLFVQAKENGKKIVIVSENNKSPSTAILMKELQEKYPNVENIAYSATSASLQNRSYKNDCYVEYDLEKCNYVIGLGSDFLATGDGATHFSKQYASKKETSLKGKAFKHVQIESVMSMTGSNADERYALEVNEVASFLLLVYSKLSGKTLNVKSSKQTDALAMKLTRDLLKNRDSAVVINGYSDLNIQKIVNNINELIGAYSKIINLYKDNYVNYDNPENFEKFVDSLVARKTEVDVVIFLDVNPYYNYYDVPKLDEAMSKISKKIAFSFSENETTVKCQYVAPLSHQYESWNDTVISSSEISVTQPVIVSLHNSKQFQDVFLGLIDKNITFNEYMKEVWKKEFYPLTKGIKNFDLFWIDSVQKGIVNYSAKKIEVSEVLQDPAESTSMLVNIDENSEYTLMLYEKIAIGDGRYANNPWLQELPDPITKVTWDNYFLISPRFAKDNSLITGDMIQINVGRNSLVAPVLVQPGMATKTIAIAVGYGRKVTGKVGLNVGKNSFVFASLKNGTRNWSIPFSKFQKTGKKYDLALTQTHHSIEGRDLYRETTLSDYVKNPKSGNMGKTHLISMWSDHDKKGHQWAMAIDLNKCNGCSACVVSCNAENNVPVVGREEVLNRREMHWMRIDRYYKGDEENPSVAFQPMACHHCDNAPCESVCPVLATVQSSDGLNQQVYNRCVGTRYCANNCPYKVRRFNWFDYPHQDPNEKMVLNPDVAVRSRGVMEKCSLCIQRIQEVKLQAKKEGREIKDGEIKLACQQSCSSDAIVFGDLMDPKSKISQMVKDSRNFTVLEELNIKPRLSYLTKVKNKD